MIGLRGWSCGFDADSKDQTGRSADGSSRLDHWAQGTWEGLWRASRRPFTKWSVSRTVVMSDDHENNTMCCCNNCVLSYMLNVVCYMVSILDITLLYIYIYYYHMICLYTSFYIEDCIMIYDVYRMIYIYICTWYDIWYIVYNI